MSSDPSGAHLRPTPIPMPSVAVREDIGRLPTPLSTLVGREHELAALAALLRDPAVRLVTLTGPGGVGKTRLALAGRRPRRSAFADGAAFVELAAVRDPELVVPAIARALRVRDPGDRRSRRRWRPSCAPKSCCWCWTTSSRWWRPARTWRSCCGPARGLTVLVTSRERLLRSAASGAARAAAGRAGPDGAAGDGRDASPCSRAARCGSSSSGRGRCGPDFALTDGERRRPSPRSAGGWTGCRWRSSWRRRGCSSSPPAALLARLERACRC